MIFYSETTSAFMFAYQIHRKFIVIGTETNEKINPEEHCPQNINSHCIITNSFQSTLHYFQCRISAMRLGSTDFIFGDIKN